MQQKSLWDDMEAEEPIIPARRIQPLPAEPTHYHIELWFYDPRRRPVRMCSEEADYYTRYDREEEVWSVGGCGGSLTREGCVICNPPEDEEE